MRRKMSIEDRAKQVLPFAALKGHQEALKIKEEEVEEEAVEATVDSDQEEEPLPEDIDHLEEELLQEDTDHQDLHIN